MAGAWGNVQKAGEWTDSWAEEAEPRWRKGWSKKSYRRTSSDEHSYATSHEAWYDEWEPFPEADIVAAIESLYKDCLQPFGRLVRKRMGENAEAAGWSLTDSDLGRLREACEQSPKITVETTRGGEWTALLTRKPRRAGRFVDIYRSDDDYPESLWLTLRRYFEKLRRRGETLPGGRYACARALLDADLPHLRERSLGEACNIVQLAMTDRKLLGYRDGTIVPYADSHCMVKDRAAERGVGSTNGQTLPLASWEALQECLPMVLPAAEGRSFKKEIQISTLKRIFRSHFQLELSETKLGYARLSDLLQDVRLAGICAVQLQESGYVMTPALVAKDHCLSDGSTASTEGQQEIPSESVSDAASASGACAWQLPGSELLAEKLPECLSVMNTFFHAPAEAPMPMRRCQSLPPDLFSPLLDTERRAKAHTDPEASATWLVPPGFLGLPEWHGGEFKPMLGFLAQPPQKPRPRVPTPPPPPRRPSDPAERGTGYSEAEENDEGWAAEVPSSELAAGELAEICMNFAELATSESDGCVEILDEAWDEYGLVAAEPRRLSDTWDPARQLCLSDCV